VSANANLPLASRSPAGFCRYGADLRQLIVKAVELLAQHPSVARELRVEVPMAMEAHKS